MVNPVFPLYVAILSAASFALILFVRAARPEAVVPRRGRMPPRRAVAALFALLVVLFGALWTTMLAPAMATREPPAGATIFVLDLAFALPLTAVAAAFLWRGRPAGDLLAVPLLLKVGILGLSVLLGTACGALFFGAAPAAGEYALYALMGFGPLALLRPFLRALEVRG